MPGAFIQDDLSAMLSVADFAHSAAWGEGFTTIAGIYDDDEVEIDRGDGQAHLIRATRFMTKSSHGVPDGDTLTIADIDYTVAWQRDDGTGVVTLFLEKV